MTNGSSNDVSRLARDKAQRGVAQATGFSLRLMALLAPFARFGVLKTLNDSSRTTSTRSPAPAIFGSLVAGASLAIAFLLSLASGGSEPVVTGSVLVAFGFGWGLMGFLSSRFSAQPQAWTAVPAAVLGSIGLGLVVFQPGPALMDLLGWVWPLAISGLAIWMFGQVRASLRG